MGAAAHRAAAVVGKQPRDTPEPLGRRHLRRQERTLRRIDLGGPGKEGDGGWARLAIHSRAGAVLQRKHKEVRGPRDLCCAAEKQLGCKGDRLLPEICCLSPPALAPFAGSGPGRRPKEPRRGDSGGSSTLQGPQADLGADTGERAAQGGDGLLFVRS